MSPINKIEVIDQNKIRSRAKLGTIFKRMMFVLFREGLFFDGRQDYTITQVLGEDKKFHRKTLLEESITIVTEPEANYFDHSGSSQDTINSIVKSLKDRNVSTDYIQAVGCNGTNMNTGQMAGVICRPE